jgi:hypothetical protein
MSARLKLQETNKIGEIFANIYRNYANLVPDIYIFRVWIMQINVGRIPPILDINSILASATSAFNEFSDQINSIDIKKLSSATS